MCRANCKQKPSLNIARFISKAALDELLQMNHKSKLNSPIFPNPTYSLRHSWDFVSMPYRQKVVSKLTNIEVKCRTVISSFELDLGCNSGCLPMSSFRSTVFWPRTVIRSAGPWPGPALLRFPYVPSILLQSVAISIFSSFLNSTA